MEKRRVPIHKLTGK